MEAYLKRAGELISRLALINAKNPSVVPYFPQKTKVSGKEKQYFRRDKPEEHGVSSTRIYRMLAELEAEPRANVHSVLILKDGAVISEASRPGYSVNTAQLSHSMTKSIIGMAIGFLFDMGKISLSEKLVDIFPEYEYRDPNFPLITVKHLLTMTAGVKISELGSVTESEWTRAYFSSELAFAPGANFKYNSMHSYMLAKIVEKISGMGIMEFLRPRLFFPLEIENVFWELGPEGLEKGGWGIYLSPESWAKLGYMMLSGGSFFGKRILSEAWVKESTLAHAETNPELGDFNYGYQLWRAREGEDFLFNGMLGQNTWINPQNKVVVVLTSGNNELFQSSPALEIVRKYLYSNVLSRPVDRAGLSLLREKEKRFFASRRAVLPMEKKKGLKYLLGFGEAKPYNEDFYELFATYAFPQNNHGILPAFVRVMQNNYSGGIEKIKIERLGDGILVSSLEGGIWHSFKSGFYDYETSVCDFGGEKYIVSSIANTSFDDNGELAFDIELIFPELPNTRILRFVPHSDSKITLKMLETPNQRLAIPFIDNLTEGNKKIGLIFDFIEKKLGEDFFISKISNVFEPTIVGVDEAHPNAKELLSHEALFYEQSFRGGKMLYSLLSKYFSEDSEGISKRNVMTDVLSFIFGRGIDIAEE